MMKHKSKSVLFAAGLFILSARTCMAQSVTFVTVPVRTADYHAMYVACQDDPNRPAHFRGGGCPGSFEGSAVTSYAAPVKTVQRVWVNGNCSPTPPVYNLVVPQYKTYYVTQKIQNNQYSVLQKNYHTTTTNYGKDAKR